MVEISKYGSGEGPGRATSRAYSTGDDGGFSDFPNFVLDSSAPE